MRMIGVGTFTTTPRMKELVNEVLDSNRISYGQMSVRFEAQFSYLHDSRFGLLSNSGTSSLQVAIQALKELYNWEDGSEVLVPAVTFVATVNVLLHNKLTPVLVDVEPDYYGIDTTDIERNITAKTVGMLPVHLFGQPCDMKRIMEIASHYRLKVVEDSCECMFVKHHGRATGSWGDIGCFSTYVAHLLTTGVGGLAITHSVDYAAKMRSLLNHGRDNIYIQMDDDDNLAGDRLSQVIGRRFKFESVGHSFRATEMEAALGVAQLETWPDMLAKRQANAYRLLESLAPLEAAGLIVLPKQRPQTGHAWMMFPIVCVGTDKWGLVRHLEARGIETRDMLPLTNQPVYKTLFCEDDYPVAKWINTSGFYVGCHQDLTHEDTDYITEAMFDYMKVVA